jgi:hypothetical protein
MDALAGDGHGFARDYELKSLGYFSRLPNELIDQIFSTLDLDSLTNMSRVSKAVLSFAVYINGEGIMDVAMAKGQLHTVKNIVEMGFSPLKISAYSIVCALSQKVFGSTEKLELVASLNFPPSSLQHGILCNRAKEHAKFDPIVRNWAKKRHLLES